MRIGGGSARAWSRRCPSMDQLAAEQPKWALSNIVWTYPQQRLLEELARNDLVAYTGGNFSGKTWPSIAIAVGACLGFYRAWCPVPANVVVVGLAQKQARNAMARYLKTFIPKSMVKRQTERDSMPEVTEFWNDSVLSTRTIGQGEAGHRGGRDSLIILDEGSDPGIFEESLFRVREDMDSRIVITLTPTEGVNWMYDDLILKAEERSVSIITASTFENGTPPCTWCKRTRSEWDPILADRGVQRGTEAAWDLCWRCKTYGVEPRLSVEKAKKLEKRVPDKNRLLMRLEGKWANLSGDQAFEVEEIQALKAYCSEPMRSPGGRGTWEPKLPGATYDIGVDAARGTGRDESVIQVIKELPIGAAEQALIWADNEKKWNDWIGDIIEIAEIYNDALTCVEWASAGEGIMPVLMKNSRVRLYEHVPADKRAYSLSTSMDRVGFRSTESSRHRILMQFIRGVRSSLTKGTDGKLRVTPGRENALYLRDMKTVEQCGLLFYNREKHGKIEVRAQQHDDRVYAMALAWEARTTHGRRFGPEETDDLNEALWRQQRNAFKSSGLHPWVSRRIVRGIYG